MDFAISHVEQVLRSDFSAARDFQKRYSSWHVLVFCHPVGQDVVRRGPAEIPDPGYFNALLVKQAE